MNIATLFKTGFFGESLAKQLSAEGNFVVVASSDRVGLTIGEARLNNAQLLIFEADGLKEDDTSRLKAMRETSTILFLAIVTSKKNPALHGIDVDSVVEVTITTDKLVKEIRDLGKKKLRLLMPTISRPKINDRPTLLTPREHEVSLKVAEGLSNREIAEDLKLAEQTVKNLVSVVMRKMSCSNRVQVALKLAKSGQPQDHTKKEA